MQFVVLGAAGSIGNAVARRARFAGHAVRAVVRDPGKRIGLPPGTEVVEADLLQADDVRRVCEGADVIVHAANVPYPEWPHLLPHLARNALAAAESAGAVLAFPGNVYVYGRPTSRRITENHPQEPRTIKGKVRLDVERTLLEAHRGGRIRLVLPRYPDFYGPNVVNDLMRPIFESALSGKPCRWPIDADAPHEFILIDDAAVGMLRLIGTAAAHGRAVHVPGPGPIPPRDFIRLAYEAAGHAPQVRGYGRRTIRLAGLFNRTTRSAYEMLYLFEDPVVLDGSLYKSLTGLSPPATPYEEGVPRTVEWFRTHGV